MNIRFYLEELYYLFKKSRNEFIFLTTIYFLSFTLLSALLSAFSYTSKILSENVKASYMKVFLKDEAKEKEITLIKTYLSPNPLLEEVRYVSKEMAREEFKSRFPKYSGLLEIFSESPFPQNLELKFKEKAIGTSQIKEITQFLSNFPFVSNVQHNYDTALKLFEIKRLLSEVILFFMLAFVILYIPLNLSFTKSILERERKLFDLVEYLGTSRKGLGITFVLSVAIPLLLMGLVNYLIFRKVSHAFQLPLWPVTLLVIFFIVLQLIISLDVLEK